MVDFNRDVFCVLGLPFDAIDIDEAVRRIRDAAFAPRRCFVSTPNLNFAIGARVDPSFYGSVLRSDLSLVDGMPLVWIARLLGLPVRGRVSGADVFEALQTCPGPPLSVYLFGGNPGVAHLASERINSRGGGVRCVGYDTPGFGSVESMSSSEQIDRINRSGAQFVVVALGAAKGQAWIEHNAPRLNAPVLSHLGAVINFASGHVARAPRGLQVLGLEWLWRIREEPTLWRRYWRDGVLAAGLVCGRVLPDVIRSRVWLRANQRPPRIERRQTSNDATLALQGSWQFDDSGELRAALKECAEAAQHVTVDLNGVSDLGNSLVATLLLAHGWFTSHTGFRIIGANDAVRATFRNKLAEILLIEGN